MLADVLSLRQHTASETYVALGPDSSITRPRWNNVSPALAAVFCYLFGSKLSILGKGWSWFLF